MAQLLRFFVDNGINKVRFTGGEPLVRSDIQDIIRSAGMLRTLGLRTIAITTNGIVLSRKLDSLLAAGLTHVNLSLDTLDPLKFELIARRRGHDRVLEAIDHCLAAQLSSVKINCVVMRGINDEEVVDFVALTKYKDVEVRFIEYMPFDGNKWSEKRFVSYATMLEKIKSRYPDIVMLPSQPNEVSKTYQVPGHRGRIGFITSMSEHFCSSCNRLRVTADGQLKVCLFDNKEVSLRDALRGGKSELEIR